MDLSLTTSKPSPLGQNAFRPSAKANLKELTSDKESWVEYLTVSYEDKPISQPMEFSRDNKKIYWIWGEGSDLGIPFVFFEMKSCRQPGGPRL